MKYIQLYNEGFGGNGFHECLNFAAPVDEAVRIYLPPGYVPAQASDDDEFLIFTCTYQQDAERPSHLVGVHAGVKLVNRHGALRRERVNDDITLTYHAEARPELTTLLLPSISYDVHAGRHMPVLERWGFGLRYIECEHARNIIADVYAGIDISYQNGDLNRRQFLSREAEVLRRIKALYLGGPALPNIAAPPPPDAPSPDQELGDLGEKIVYELELQYAEKIGAPPSAVDWVSRAYPTSPYDIKTVRSTDNGFRPHFIEVKSSASSDYRSVFISEGQVNFFRQNPAHCSFVFLSFSRQKRLMRKRELTLTELEAEFDLLPIKYRLQEKIL